MHKLPELFANNRHWAANVEARHPGFFGELAAAQFIRGQLHGVSTVDPMILGIVALVVMSVGALAAYVPAHRGSRADPMVALRSD